VTDVAPLYGLRIRTPRLELRLGSRDELLELGRLAERGVHPPEEMPFAVAWTDRIGEADFLDGFLAYHEGKRASWSRDAWTLELLVWEHATLVGCQAVMAKEFGRRRCVSTGSWLGEAYQRRGIGTEMRAAVLDFAFSGLGAVEAQSGWLEGNEASRRVSEKLGYVLGQKKEHTPRGVPVIEQGVVLKRDAWSCPVPVTIEGLEPCLPLFGVT
jgi:RimJ/RimL family protein N-acetyltransferase